MVPFFTIVTTLITIAVTGLLTWILWKINEPLRRRSEEAPNAEGEGGD